MPPSAEIVEAVGVQLAKWRADPESFVLQSYRQDPEGYPVTVDVAQSRILRAVAEHDRVAVRSSHGIGKTTTASWLTHWWLSTRKPSLVVTLAGTWNHLEDKLWPEIHSWGRHWRLREAFEWQTMGLYHQNQPDSWRAEPSSSDKPENVEGWHSPNLLVIVDEAKRLPDEVWAAIRGAMTQTARDGSKTKVVVLSTPPLQKAGWYADLFGTKSGGWELIHVAAHESTRVSKEWIAEMARDFGEDSAVYQSKVLGDIPEAGSDSVLQLRWIEAAQKLEARKDRKPVIVTCDVARDGEDLTTLGRIKDAKFDIVKWSPKNDLMEVVAWCKTAVEENHAAILCLDDTGLGGGVTDRLKELQREEKFPRECRIIAVRFGDSADRKDRFHKEKDELWWKVRDALREGKLALPTDHELAALQLPRGSSMKSQLAAPIYQEDSLSRIVVFDKKGESERTKALPSKSPDLAHALILGVKFWLKAAADTSPDPATTTQEVFNRAVWDSIKPTKPTGGGNPFRR